MTKRTLTQWIITGGILAASFGCQKNETAPATSNVEVIEQEPKVDLVPELGPGMPNEQDAQKPAAPCSPCTSSATPSEKLESISNVPNPEKVETVNPISGEVNR